MLGRTVIEKEPKGKQWAEGTSAREKRKEKINKDFIYLFRDREREGA